MLHIIIILLYYFIYYIKLKFYYENNYQMNVDPKDIGKTSFPFIIACAGFLKPRSIVIFFHIPKK